MLATAKEMPGFVEFKSFKADDGERVSLVYWQDHETMAAWRKHPRHRIAQGHGRAKWYQEFPAGSGGYCARNEVRSVSDPRP